jgi:hypothetical protein
MTTAIRLSKIFEHAEMAYSEPRDVDIFKNRIDSPDAICLGWGNINILDWFYIVEYPDYYVAAFRGTDSEEGISVPVVKRWIRNFDIRPLVQDGSWGKGSIHRGFYNAWKAVKIDFYYELFEMDPMFLVNKKPIIIIGHSLGACMALLCSRDLVKNLFYKRVLCVVFGSPNLFTKEGQREYDELGIHTEIFINGRDGAHKFPHSLVKPSTVRHLNKPRLPIYVPSIKDHLPENYRKVINKNDFNYILG